MIKKTFAVMLVSAALLGCSKMDSGQKGPYLAKIDGTTITQADMDKELGSLPEYAKGMFEDAAGREKFLNEIINKEVLYKEAVKKGLDKNQDYLKKVEEFKKLTLVSELIEKEVMDKAKVSDQDIKDYYEKNKQDFAVTKEIRASHILVKTEAEARKVLERLKKGDKFADIAREVSIDKGSAKNGGDLGYFKKGQMVPAFEKAAASLKVGSINEEPVKTEFGYHIILVTDKKRGEVIEFERIRDMLSQKLSAERQKEAFDKYIADVKKNYKIEINKDALAKASSSPTPEEKEEKKAEEAAPKAEEKGEQGQKKEETKKEEPKK
ncbi:MAG: peptidyl-prolyl cis-trans isomerase [Thermodesulfovibrionales bacterium]